MHELTKPEVYNAITYAKNLDEDTGNKIIERFQLDHSALAETIFGIFPMAIGDKDQDMANLFKDLCFEVICVFEYAFNPLPAQSSLDPDWVKKQALLLVTELEAMLGDNTMEPKFKDKLQDRFYERMFGETSQIELIKLMNTAIDDFVNESPCRLPALDLAQTMIFVVVRLFCSLYSHAAK